MITIFIAVAIVLLACAVALVAAPLLIRRGDRENSPIAATVAAVTLPALAVLMYIAVSNHDWTATAGPAQPPEPVAAIPDIVLQLEQRLANEPEDAGGWQLLGRSYLQLQRLDDARRAFEFALALAPSNYLKLSLAEIDIMQDRGSLGGEPGRVVEQILALEPDNPKALFYGGMVATLRGDHDLTRARWQKLLGMSPPENIRHMLEQQLGQLGSPTAAAAPEPQAQKGDGAIAISLSVAPDLATRIDGNAILFVLARRPDVPGPPIAAIRASASPLPATLSISDANAMIAGRSLQGLDTVELVARVSRGGDPIAAPGDLYGEAIWNAAANSERRVEIVIDRIVE